LIYHKDNFTPLSVPDLPPSKVELLLPAVDRRAETYRRHAIELAEAARREDDKSRRRYLLDLARNYIAVADQLDPQASRPAANVQPQIGAIRHRVGPHSHNECAALLRESFRRY